MGRSRLVLRLLAPQQSEVVDVVRHELAEQPGACIETQLSGDLVVFDGACGDPALRRRVGTALVRVLGPAGWYDYFRPPTS